MSRGGGFRGRGRGGGGGRGGRGGRGGFNNYDQGPPESVVEIGQCMHACEGDLVCKNTGSKVPYFNAPIYLENKSQIGKVDEIFGQISNHLFSVKLSPNMNASSFKAEQKFYIDPMKLLPLSRFMGGGGAQRGGRARGRGGRGGARGRGGGFKGGRGGRGGFTPRGGRGGFTPRGGRGRGRGFRGGR